jgi:hypothetical protein
MDINHGTTTGYARGCRCNECRAAYPEYQRKRQAAKRLGVWDARTPYRQERQPCTGPDCDRLARYLDPQPLCGGHVQQVWRGAPLTPLRQYNQVSDGAKRCTRCNTVKPLAEFNRRGKHQSPECKACWSIINRMNNYGLTFDEAKEMMTRPCAGCGTTVEGRELHIDHCHDSGVVRGVLCHNCNTVLTKHMTPEILRSLADYLERS